MGDNLLNKTQQTSKNFTGGTIYQDMSCLIFTEEMDKIIGGLE